MRTLLLDCETSPIQAWVWGLWQQNVGLNQIIEPTHVICMAYKWLGESKVGFQSTRHPDNIMVSKAWDLLDEADCVMHYNGAAFDIPHLRREFLEAGLTPPSPFRQIDLLTTARKMFRFPSNKLAYITEALGLEGKVKHEGFELWTKCLAGDPKAWKKMQKYNERDVTLLEDLYELLQPWIPSHPSHAAFTGEHVCPACGGSDLKRRGFAYTAVSKFDQWLCSSCGKWSRSTHRETGADITSVTL